MTISTTTLLNSFSGNGSVVDFTYTYPINSASELLVIIKTDATGVETTKTLTSDYTVALAGDSGGTVTMGTAPASGETLFLIRNTTKTQGTDLIENDPFSAEGLEDSFDNLQMQIQEVSNAVDRSFKVSKTNSITTSEITTSAADRANKILSFDASGNVEATAFNNLDTLNEMTDVTITSPADNEVLAYDSSSTHFINQTAAEAGLVATGAVTGITSLLATDIKIGEDNETKIDFETADEIHFYAANAEQAYVADGVFGPQTDSDVDLGTTSVRWKDAYIDSITTTGNITSAGTVSFGSITDGTITATAFVDEDDMSSDSATLIPTQQSVKAYVDAKKADMQFVLEDGDGTEVQIVKDSEVKFVEGGGIDINWTDTSTGSDADPFDLTFAIDSTVATLTGSQTLTNKTLTSPVLNGTISGSSIKDEDNMASDSASHLATQQSIKAYVDAVTTSLNAQDLDVSDGSSAIAIDLDTETLGILGGTGLTSAASGNNVTLSVDAAQTQITSVGALDAGSITSGFGNIDNGSSTITTTGQIAAGSLDISGDIDVDGTTNLDVVDIDGALTQDGGAVFNEASADVDFRVESNGNANMLFVDGGNNKVGIGTNSPAKALSLKVDGGGAATGIDIHNQGTDAADDAIITFETQGHRNYSMGIDRSESAFVVMSEADGLGTARLTIDDSGDAIFSGTVGVPTLDIMSGSSIHGTITTSSSSLTLNARNTGNMLFQSGGSEKMRIMSDGDVGIGTTDPTQNLELVVSKTASIPTDASVGSTNNGAACGMGIHNENNSAVYSGLNFETRTTHASRWLMGNEWKSSYNGDLFFRARDGASSSSEILRLKSDGTVGINTADPSASWVGANNLVVSDTSSDGGIAIISGTSGNGNIMFSDAQAGAFSDARGLITYLHNGDSMRFITANAEALRIDSSQRVGIGTSSPGELLEVNGGNAKITDDDNVYLSIDSTQSNGDEWHIFNAVSGTTSQLQFKNIDQSKLVMLLDETGKVGIGTTSPSADLEVRGSSSNGQIYLGGSTTATYGKLYSDNDGTLIASADGGNNASSSSFRVEVDASEKMRIDSSGRVGIGTTSPGVLIDAAFTENTTSPSSNYGALGNVGMRITNNSVSNNQHGSAILLMANRLTTTDQAGQVAIACDVSANKTANMIFATRNGGLNEERARLTADGKLGIGTTSPGRTLSVDGDGIIGLQGSQNAIAFTESSSLKAYITSGAFGDHNGDGLGLVTSGNEPIKFFANGGERMRITDAGIHIGGTGSANALDDYEEGTYTPTVDDENGGSYGLSTNSNTLQYTKIGRLVTIQGMVAVTSESSPNGTLRLSLPFTAPSLTDDSDYVVASMALTNNGSTLAGETYLFVQPGSYAFLYNVSEAGGTNYIQHDEVD